MYYTQALVDARSNVAAAFEKIGSDTLKEMLNLQEVEAKAEAKKRLTASDNGLSQSAVIESKSVDAPVEFGLLVPPGGDQGERIDQFTLTLNQAIKGTTKTGDAYATSKLKKVGNLLTDFENFSFILYL